MTSTQRLHDIGQSLWLDNITRQLVTSGTLEHYINELSVTGLTSNPTIFDHAISNSDIYDESIRQKALQHTSDEILFFELALEDLVQAADLFRHVHDTSHGVDGWVSLEVSPLLANDTVRTIEAASRLYAQANRPNIFIKIPGTKAGLPAIEESIFAGVPVNVTLLFSRQHYLSAAESYMRGIERRLEAGLNLDVASVASLFVSRWDVAVHERVSPALHNRLGIAVAMDSYVAYRELLASKRWQRLEAAGARPQRLLWASTGTKDPDASDILYIESLMAPDTVNTMPEKTLLAFADHGMVHELLPTGGKEASESLATFTHEGVDVGLLAAQLQEEGVIAFARSWHDLIRRVSAKRELVSNIGKQ